MSLNRELILTQIECLGFESAGVRLSDRDILRCIAVFVEPQSCCLGAFAVLVFVFDLQHESVAVQLRWQ